MKTNQARVSELRVLHNQVLECAAAVHKEMSMGERLALSNQIHNLRQADSGISSWGDFELSMAEKFILDSSIDLDQTEKSLYHADNALGFVFNKEIGVGPEISPSWELDI